MTDYELVLRSEMMSVTLIIMVAVAIIWCIPLLRALIAQQNVRNFAQRVMALICAEVIIFCIFYMPWDITVIWGVPIVLFLSMLLTYPVIKLDEYINLCDDNREAQIKIVEKARKKIELARVQKELENLYKEFEEFL